MLATTNEFMIVDYFTRKLVHSFLIQGTINTKIILGPQLYIDSLPLLIYNTNNEVRCHEIKNSLVRPWIDMPRNFNVVGNLGANGQLIGQDKDSGKLYYVSLIVI